MILKIGDRVQHKLERWQGTVERVVYTDSKGGGAYGIAPDRGGYFVAQYSSLEKLPR